jgi:porphobilinogen synthase
MVKPGLHYLDIIQKLRAEITAPIFAYHVSGEYAMLKAAANAGIIDGDAALLETMLAFKRAGADAILTYAAHEVATLIS